MLLTIGEFKLMQPSDEFSAEIDLRVVRQNAEAARDLLVDLRSRYDLTSWEYTRKVRIAPFEIPHSHPVLTLNDRYARDSSRDEQAFLAVYLHEQMHWGVTLHRGEETEIAIGCFRSAYPGVHVGHPETALDEYSTYLHIVINWLEISALSEVLGREQAEAVARRNPIYSRIYPVVLSEWDAVKATLRSTGVAPLPLAG